MTNENTNTEKQLTDVIEGDLVIRTSAGSNGSTRQLEPVKRTTNKMIVLQDDSRYWSQGDNVGREVGNASRDWRRSMMSSTRTVRLAANEAELGAVRQETRLRIAKMKEANDKAQSAREAKLERRAGRFEGTLDRYHKKVEEMLVADKDNELLKRMSSQLYDCIWKLEDNEKTLQERVAYEREDLQRLAQTLEGDMHITFTTDRRIDEAVQERKVMIDRAKHLLYLVKAVTGSLETPEDSDS